MVCIDAEPNGVDRDALAGRVLCRFGEAVGQAVRDDDEAKLAIAELLSILLDEAIHAELHRLRERRAVPGIHAADCVEKHLPGPRSQPNSLSPSLPVEDVETQVH